VQHNQDDNRSFGYHGQNDSSASSSSVAISYAKYGTNSSGIAAWACHQKDLSVDSVMCDFSALHLARPGIRDKMFDWAVDLNLCVSSECYQVLTITTYFTTPSRSSVDDSLFEKTGQRSSVSSDSVFGEEVSHSYAVRLLPPHHFRPLSILSLNSSHGPVHDDDAMISVGVDHFAHEFVLTIRCRCWEVATSVGALVYLMEASPCVRIEKRKRPRKKQRPSRMWNAMNRLTRLVSLRTINRIGVIVPVRRGQNDNGLLERQSLEDSCFVADGLVVSVMVPLPPSVLMNLQSLLPVFARPLPGPVLTSSSGAGTPPLSSFDGSSISEGSQSSVDLSQLNIALANATHPPTHLTSFKVAPLIAQHLQNDLIHRRPPHALLP
jgi:serine/arginine repetitive matrix protein 2